MLYFYVLGCLIACVCCVAEGSMEIVDFKAADLVENTLLWPVALVKKALRSTNAPKAHAAR